MSARWLAGVAVAGAASTALAGTVTFDPPVLVVDPSIADVYTVAISVFSDRFSWSSIDLIVGTTQPGVELSTNPGLLHPAFISQTAFRDALPDAVPPVPAYASGDDAEFAGFFLSSPPRGVPFPIGSFTIDVSNVQTPVHFVVQVSSLLDGRRSKLIAGDLPENLEGSMVVTVPEPATLLLLVIGGLCVWGRRSVRVNLRWNTRSVSGKMPPCQIRPGRS